MGVGKHGEELVAPLLDLNKVAEVHIPHLAETYLTINKCIDRASEDEGNVFARNGPDGGWAGMGSIYPEWTQLREEAERAFAECFNNIQKVGHVLRYVVQTYSDEDTAAGREMRKIWQDYLHPTPSAQADPHHETRSAPPPKPSWDKRPLDHNLDEPHY